jgi:plastocyanin
MGVAVHCPYAKSGVERGHAMNRYKPLNAVLVMALLLSVPNLLSGHGLSTVMESTAPAEITFDSSAPYYQPQVAVVSPGVSVRWLNSTASPHSIRHDGCLTDGTCAFQSIAVPPDSSFSIAPLPPGRYTYHCELHPIMRGVLIVLDPGASAAGFK